jgi:hypothetical protein
VRSPEENRDRRIERRWKPGPLHHEPLEETRTHHIRPRPVHDRTERRRLVVVPAEHDVPHPERPERHRATHPLDSHRDVRDHRKPRVFREQRPECPEVRMTQRPRIHDDDIDRPGPDDDLEIGHARDVVNRMIGTGHHAKPHQI